MPINFNKSDAAASQKRKNTLEFVEVRLSWAKRRNFGSEFDLDLSCFLLGQSGKIRRDTDLVFYNNPISADGSVVCHEDNRVGVDASSSGESITIDFPKMENGICQAIVAASIHDAQQRGQSFGCISDARLEVIDRRNNEILAYYDLSEDLAGDAAAVICGFVYEKDEWKLLDIDEPRGKTLADLARYYGMRDAGG